MGNLAGTMRYTFAIFSAIVMVALAHEPHGVALGEATQCTASSCTNAAYPDGGEATIFAQQLAVNTGQKSIPQTGSKANFENLVATLESLVNNDGMVSTGKGVSKFQMTFGSNNNGNHFQVTGCNLATGTSCTSTCTMKITTHLRVCPGWPYTQAKCNSCSSGFVLFNQAVGLKTTTADCRKWFVKADGVIRILTTQLRTYWLSDRINGCEAVGGLS